MFSVSGIGHNIEVKGLYVGESHDFLFGFIADARRIHEETLSHTVCFVEMPRRCRTDVGYVVDPYFKLNEFESVVEGFVNYTQTDTFENV